MSAIRINPKSVWSVEDFPFNQAVVEPDGRRVHLTGQVAWNSEGKIVGIGDATKQTEYTIDNIQKILGELGGELSDIVSLTMYYTRESDLPAIQAVRTRRFEKATGPASTGIRIAGLVEPELLVEITVVAVIPNARFQTPMR